MSDLTTLVSAARSFCTFRLSGRLYGIEVLHVREVSTPLLLTPVPQAPAAVRGLVNLRSRIFLVLDPRPLLGMPAAPSGESSRLVILKPEIGQDLGILVEEGGDIAHVRADQIEPATGTGDWDDDVASSLIAGVCKFESELMMIVDPRRITEAVTTFFDKASR